MDVLDFFANNYIFLVVFIGMILLTIFERTISSRSNIFMYAIFGLTLVYLLAEGITYYFENTSGHEASLLICNIITNTFKPLLLLLFYYLISKPQRWKLLLCILPVINMVIVAINIISNYDPALPNLGISFSSNNNLVRGLLFFSNIIAPAIVFFVIAIGIIIHYKQISASKIIVITFIICIATGASVIELLNSEYKIFGGAMCAGLMFYYIYLFLYSSKEQSRIMMEQNQMDLMISQIQPHFLYNTLNSIYHLCDVNPQLAKETIDEFSTYLRSNLNSLNSYDLIPFEKDLEHAKTYLGIEKLRFGDRVKIEYDIQYTDFCVLPLTLQPLVENAVKHGICEKEEGGTVLIKTFLEFNDIIIQIKDDGVGFDINQLDTNSRRHIGFNNVKNRVEKILKGRFGVQSEIGVGTTVTITLKRSGK